VSLWQRAVHFVAGQGQRVWGRGPSSLDDVHLSSLWRLVELVRAMPTPSTPVIC
jgi:hypothetical protein